MYFNLMHFRSKQHLPCHCIQQSSFLEQTMGNSPDIIHFETWAWSWSWTWKALWKRGQMTHVLNLCSDFQRMLNCTGVCLIKLLCVWLHCYIGQNVNLAYVKFITADIEFIWPKGSFTDTKRDIYAFFMPFHYSYSYHIRKFILAQIEGNLSSVVSLIVFADELHVVFPIDTSEIQHIIYIIHYYMYVSLYISCQLLNEWCFILRQNMADTLCSRPVLMVRAVTFSFRITKRYPVDISFSRI